MIRGYGRSFVWKALGVRTVTVRGPYVPTAPPVNKHGFTQREIDDYQHLFKQYDKNKDAKLTLPEVTRFLSDQLGDHIPDKDMKRIFKKLDINKDKKVSFLEYMLHVENRYGKFPKERDLRSVFDIYDRNNDGYLTLDQLRHALLYMGFEPAPIGLRARFSRMDSDKDGEINFVEFKKMIQEQSLIIKKSVKPSIPGDTGNRRTTRRVRS